MHSRDIVNVEMCTPIDARGTNKTGCMQFARPELSRVELFVMSGMEVDSYRINGDAQEDIESSTGRSYNKTGHVWIVVQVRQCRD